MSLAGGEDLTVYMYKSARVRFCLVRSINRWEIVLLNSNKQKKPVQQAAKDNFTGAHGPAAGSVEAEPGPGPVPGQTRWGHREGLPPQPAWSLTLRGTSRPKQAREDLDTGSRVRTPAQGQRRAQQRRAHPKGCEHVLSGWVGTRSMWVRVFSHTFTHFCNVVLLFW